MPAISFSGIASGLDTDSIIKALTQARQSSITPIENKVKANEDKIDALEELNTKLLKFRDTLDAFKSSSGTAIQKKATSSKTEAVTASLTGNALPSSTEIEVFELARAATFSFTDRFTAGTDLIAAGLTSPANITFTTGQGATQKIFNVEVTSTTTLDSLVTSMNQAMGGEVVTSVVNTGPAESPSYAIMMYGQKSGIDEGELQISVDPAIQGEGRFVAAPAGTQARNARFNVSGIGEVQRSSNSVTGLIPGVTLQLLQENSGPVQITVANDSEKTVDKIRAFIDAYNDIVSFIEEKDRVSRVETDKGTSIEFGTLSNTSMDEQILRDIRDAMASATSGLSGSSVQILADLGIRTRSAATTENGKTLSRGTMELVVSDTRGEGTKQPDFTTAFSQDPAAVQKVLESLGDKLAAQTGVIQGFVGLNQGIDAVQNTTKDANTALRDRIERINTSISKQEETLKKVFTNLETTIARLNSGSSAISSILASAGTR